MQNQTYLHMSELIAVIEERTSLEMGWFERCKLHCKDLKTWKPEIYIMLNSGVISYIVSNANMHIHIFNYNDEQELAENKKEFEEKFLEWEENLIEGINKGFLKKIL